MNEQEQKAIKWMQNVRDDAVVTLDHIAKEEPNVSPMLYAGRKEKAETIIKGFEELEQYRAIGTVEECREAMEKQKAKKPITKSRGVYDEDNGDYLSDEKYNICPSCNPMREVYMGCTYCRWCGQKLDWSGEE